MEKPIVINKNTGKRCGLKPTMGDLFEKRKSGPGSNFQDLHKNPATPSQNVECKRCGTRGLITQGPTTPSPKDKRCEGQDLTRGDTKKQDSRLFLGADCCQLFPSLDAEATAAIVSEVYLESDMKVEEVDWKELSK